MVLLLRALAGVSLLTLGRKLFWVFVGAIGFEAGWFLAARLFTGQSEILRLIIALVVGLLGALLAIFVQNVVIVAAGFLAGGYLGVAALDTLGVETGWPVLLALILGGVLGALLIGRVFDWALILLSSLSGALILANVFVPRGGIFLVVVVVLFLVGVAIQAAWWRRRR